MKRKSISAAILTSALLVFTSAFAAEKNPSIGVVDFGKCIMDSKYGKKEQESFENLKTRMQKAVEDLDSQMTETANKLQDKDLLDSLSPEAEQELRIKFQTLGEEMQRYQGQFYQVMQQANMKLMQNMHDHIMKASNTVADTNKLTLILNKDAAFHYSPALEITTKVIEELDKKFDKESTLSAVTEKKEKENITKN